MSLETLASCIEQARERIQEHGQLLRQSEALTRYVLIDPLLRALGWDTEDPARVRPEYRDAGGYADYALMGTTIPAALVEAKKLGEPLASGIEQALNYCNRQGINYMLVTDGDRWEMYEVFRQARIEDRRLVSLSVQSDPTHEAALKLLHLWQPNLGSGTSVAAPPEVVIVGAQESATPSRTQPERGPLLAAEAANPISLGWAGIEVVKAGGGAKAPVEIKFPNGGVRPVRFWNQVLIEVAEWLSRDGILTAQKCPIGRGYDRYIVHTEARHPNGKDFFQPRKLSTGIFVEVHVSAAKAIDDARLLMDRLGQGASPVELRLE